MTPDIPEGTHSPAPDEVLSTLADDERLAALQTLEAADGDTMSFESLSEQVATRVAPDERGPPSMAHRRRVRTSLYHVHLPKLADCGMVVHDTDTMNVRTVLGDHERELLQVADPDGSHV